MTNPPGVRVYTGDALAKYQFGEGHLFGAKRYPAFMDEFHRRGLGQSTEHGEPKQASRETIQLFHDTDYVQFVEQASLTGEGLLDWGDTPAFPGVYEAAATVVGTVIEAIDSVMATPGERAFVPIAGLHHARTNSAGGFCVFNDCGVAIKHLQTRHGIHRIAYVDIDAHHADGVFYGFEDDPDLCFVDFHEDGRYLYPGSGDIQETGTGEAAGTKLNIPMPPGCGDAEFFAAWDAAEAFIERAKPEFFIFQCGADSIIADPITHLGYTSAAHRHAATQLRTLADRYAHGRLVALGGGGYDTDNLSTAWCDVIAALL